MRRMLINHQPLPHNTTASRELPRERTDPKDNKIIDVCNVFVYSIVSWTQSDISFMIQSDISTVH